MPKAILAIRSYPLTVLLAALVFALTLVLTTTSIGKVGIGGDDEGSGFGGTGRAGESGGSGFGGTGSPSPFFGVTEEDEGEKARQELDRIREELRPVDLPEALQRSIENNLMRESAHIAEAFKAPVVEAPLVAPAQDRVDTERLSRSGAMPAMQIARPTMQLSVPVVMPEPANIIESFQLPSAEPEIAQLEIAEKSSPVLPEQIGVLDILELSKELKINSEVESIKEELKLVEREIIQQESKPASTDSDERRMAPERIPRPELPPFQRIRPAVDRISISAPRPQPMRI